MMEVQLVEQSCTLAVLVGFGPDASMYVDYQQREQNPDCHIYAAHQERLVDFKEYLHDFDNGCGAFKPDATNTYDCPGRSGLLVNINEHQRLVWGEVLLESGFVELWSFENNKSGNRVYVYARAKVGQE